MTSATTGSWMGKPSYLSPAIISLKLSRTNLINRLNAYGFVECGYMVSFLLFVCESETPDTSSLRFIYEKLKACLRIHNPDAGARTGKNDVFFHDLNTLKDELEYVLSIYF